MRFSTRTSPAPWHVGQRCDGTVPLPRQTGQGRFTANPPWPNETVPRPLHSGHVLMVAPFAAPVPLHVGQTSGITSVIGTVPPSAATRNGIVISVSTSSGSASRPPPPPPPPRPPRAARRWTRRCRRDRRGRRCRNRRCLVERHGRVRWVRRHRRRQSRRG